MVVRVKVEKKPREIMIIFKTKYEVARISMAAMERERNAQL